MPPLFAKPVQTPVQVIVEAVSEIVNNTLGEEGIGNRTWEAVVSQFNQTKNPDTLEEGDILELPTALATKQLLNDTAQDLYQKVLDNLADSREFLLELQVSASPIFTI